MEGPLVFESDGLFVFFKNTHLLILLKMTLHFSGIAS